MDLATYPAVPLVCKLQLQLSVVQEGRLNDGRMEWNEWQEERTIKNALI
jgi:hypothetical protein